MLNATYLANKYNTVVIYIYISKSLYYVIEDRNTNGNNDIDRQCKFISC